MSQAFRILRTTGVALVAALCCSLPALGQDFKVAMSSPPTSMDPHFQNITTNANVIEHMFEPLVMRTADGKLAPGLAESWSLINGLTWEFKIRKGAKFSDGSPVTAEDVVFNYALDVARLAVDGAFTGAQVRDALAGHELGAATLSGTYTLNRRLRGAA